MFDNPQTVKFHLEDLERQARPFLKNEREKSSLAHSPLIGMLIVAALVGLIASIAPVV